ncbi:hypothetical protein [Acidipila sp. EB88]|uniref:hypothetical protein n=1 Tax=Acidipila sp. EB88 TaxID=2305226 RepID=UPI0013151F5A|nr:hypothetical protein [Acidipila sp. EB88]
MAEGRRFWVAVTMLAVLAGVAWSTMERGSIRIGVLVVLAGFALRITLAQVARVPERAVDNKEVQEQ